ncbi:MAG: zf-HC2 domain-containing protein [candidate division WOR-3 bacterium]
MNCNQVTKKLSQYLLNELNTTEHEKIGRHLAICSKCASVLNQFKMVFEAVSALRSLNAPCDVDNALLRFNQEIKSQSRQMSIKFLLARRFVWSFSVIVLIILAGILQHYLRKPNDLDTSFIDEATMISLTSEFSTEHEAVIIKDELEKILASSNSDEIFTVIHEENLESVDELLMILEPQEKEYFIEKCLTKYKIPSNDKLLKIIKGG